MRLSLLDGFRGFFLIMMMSTHFGRTFGAELRHLSHHRFGFVEDAQGFVFLSGLVVALVYGKILLRHSEWQMTRSLLKRVGTIYIWHVMLIVAIFGLAYFSGGPDGNVGSFAGIGQKGWQDFFLSITLVSGPAYIDILPMYVIFLGLTPAFLILLNRGHGTLLACIVIGCWLFAQTYILNIELNYLSQVSGIEEDGGQGFGLIFNRFAWQLLFFAGALFGMALAKGDLDLSILGTHMGKTVFYACLTAIVIFAIMKIYPRFGHDNQELVAMDRWNLSALRLLNFIVVLYILTYLCSAAGRENSSGFVRVVSEFLIRIFNWKPFVFLGQHSLQVYAFHVLVIYVALALLPDPGRLDIVGRNLLFLVAIASLYIPAFWNHTLKAKRLLAQERGA